ncbi:MAG TPA: OmpA family protein [Fluviicola sp.]|nr:OmpA family protein [Fluviicola sp.]
MKTFPLLFFVVLLSFSGLGQAKVRKANEHYERLEYFSCAPIYAELAKKTIQGKGKTDWENVRRAAFSNKQIFQYNRARFYYSKLHETNRLTEADYVEYIDLLRTIGKYEVADELLADAIKVYPQNNFVALLKDRNSDFGHLMTDSAIYSIEALSINSGMGDFCPTFYENGILYMSKSKNAGFLNGRYGWDNAFFINMLHATYDLDSTLMKGKVLKDAFFSRAHDGPVSFSPDGNRMVITKNTLGKHNDQDVVVLAIYFSERINGEWSEVKPFLYNNPAYNVGHACFSPDGRRIYFASEQPGGFGGADLYYSDFLDGGWNPPVNLGPKVNTDQDELFPAVSENTLYFSSKGHFGIGGLDIFTIPLSLNGIVLNMGFPINTSYDDFGIVANKDEKGGFFSSNRGDFVDRIYSWQRKDPTIYFEGTVAERYAEMEPVPNQWVVFKDLTTFSTDTLYTDSLGQFSTQLLMNHDYHFSTEKQYFALESPLSISTVGIVRDSTLRGELVLKPLTIFVTLKVVERGTKSPIPYAKTTVTASLTGKDTVLTTDNQGLVTLQVDRYADYLAHASKRGYVDDQTTFKTDNESDKVIELLLQLPTIKKGDKFKLENIFYDYNKSTLRPESMAALDKLADFIKENKLKIELSSHTDARGNAPYNQKLSQARAQSCVDYLILKGVPKANIIAKGYGETQLLNRCKDGVTCSEEEHQENRRTEIKIL